MHLNRRLVYWPVGYLSGLTFFLWNILYNPNQPHRYLDLLGDRVHHVDVHVGHVAPEALRRAHVVPDVVNNDQVLGHVAQLANDVVLRTGVGLIV